ncbi:hypothetical protein D3C80_1770930 [compost metagenome]
MLRQQSSCREPALLSALLQKCCRLTVHDSRADALHGGEAIRNPAEFTAQQICREGSLHIRSCSNHRMALQQFGYLQRQPVRSAQMA